MTRERVLGAVREALGRTDGTGRKGPPGPLAPWSFPPVEESDVIARFMAEAALVDAHVVDAKDGRWWDAVRGELYEVDAAFCGPGVDAANLGLRPADADEAAARPGAVVGIALGVCGIAESGSVVVDEDGSHLPSLLTDLSVLILPKARIVAGLEALPPPGADVRNRVLVTGPSRTADIEKRLVLGAHGPRRLVVALV